mgnify:CR=1 FL=1
MFLYNGQFIPEQELCLPITNRAFQYGDGFFETVMVVNGRLRFWSDHLVRMQEAAHALHLELPAYFCEPAFEQQLLQLADENSGLAYGRLKLKAWRAGAGLYTPETNLIDWLATVQPATPLHPDSISIGVCQNIRTICSPFSHFKGPNALVYTLAGLEKKQTGYDDMLLLNSQGIVSELISSNLFWMMDNKLFTPALDTGCVNGIVRRNILRWCRKNHMKVHEAYFSPQRLHDAHTVFAANVTGIKSIESINYVALQQDEAFLHQLNRDLFSEV